MDREQIGYLFSLVYHSVWMAGGDGDGLIILRDNLDRPEELAAEFARWMKDNGKQEYRVISHDGLCWLTEGQSGILIVPEDEYDRRKAEFPTWYGSAITVWV